MRSLASFSGILFGEYVKLYFMNKKLPGIIIILAAVGLLFFSVIKTKLNDRPEIISDNINPMESTLTLSSTAFEHMATIPAIYTCDGENINPPFQISGVPENAESLVLIMDDPDAPMGTWDHWIKFNIPKATTMIAEAEEPDGVSGVGTGGNLKYQGPCPPDREHRYFFKLYAIDTILDLKEGASKEDVEDAMEGHILARTELIGLYDRVRE